MVKGDMKLITPIYTMFAEYVIDTIERIRFRKQEPSLLAYSVSVFTNESWLDSLNRQKRLFEYFYYYNTLDSFKNSVSFNEVA